MVDTYEPVEVASQTRRGESQKVDQIILTLEQYNIKIGALQETKWFGFNVLTTRSHSIFVVSLLVP